MNQVSETDATSQRTILNHAIDYHLRGLCVIPINPQSKISAVKWGQYQRKQPAAWQIRDWFSSHPTWRIAVVFGEVSGNLCCRDFDTEESYLAWRRLQPALAASLPTAKTRRGYHVYFRANKDEAQRVRDALGATGGNGAIAVDEGELRMDSGCYCLLPPSSFDGDGKYEWIVPFPASVSVVFEVSPIDAKLFADSCFSTLHIHTGTHVTQVTHVVYKETSIEGVDMDTGLLAHCRRFSAFPEQLAVAISDAIDRTLPSAVGERNKKIFSFVRCLKGIPELRERQGKELIGVLRSYFARCAVVMAGGCPSAEMDFDEASGRFLKAWGDAKFHSGVDVISDIWRKIRELPVPACAGRFESSKTQYLVSLCRELQSMAGKKKAFYLDCRTAGRLLGESHAAANARLNLLIEVGVLKLSKKHDRKKKQSREFRYNGD